MFLEFSTMDRVQSPLGWEVVYCEHAGIYLILFRSSNKPPPTKDQQLATINELWKKFRWFIIYLRAMSNAYFTLWLIRGPAYNALARCTRTRFVKLIKLTTCPEAGFIFESGVVGRVQMRRKRNTELQVDCIRNVTKWDNNVNRRFLCKNCVCSFPTENIFRVGLYLIRYHGYLHTKLANNRQPTDSRSRF